MNEDPHDISKTGYSYRSTLISYLDGTLHISMPWISNSIIEVFGVTNLSS